MAEFTIYNADCLDVMRGMDADSVDAVITDPPYGIGADKKNAHSSIRDSANWARMNWDEDRPDYRIFEIIQKYKYVAIWGGNYFSDLLNASPNWLIWLKPQAGSGFSLADAELCWTNGTGAVRSKTFARRDGHQHPTQKPVAVMEWTMRQLKIPVGATVIDPFMGSGTTGVACMNTGRNFIGIELDPTYFQIAKERISRAQTIARGEFPTITAKPNELDNLPLFAEATP